MDRIGIADAYLPESVAASAGLDCRDRPRGSLVQAERGILLLIAANGFTV